MRHLSFPRRFFGVVSLLFFAVLLSVSAGLASDFADFEKLLFEAIRSSQEGSASESKPAAKTAQAAPSAKQPPPPSPGTPVRSVPAKSAAPSTAAQPESSNSMSDGWTTVQPNPPGLVIPVPRTTLPPAVREFIQAAPADLFSESDEPESAETPAESLEEPKALFEPDPIESEGNQTPSAEGQPESLFDDIVFEEELTVITDEEEVNVIEPESAPADAPSEMEELETLSEPRRVNESRDLPSKAPSDKTPGDKTLGEEDKLSSLLEDLANEPVTEGFVDSPETTRVTVSVPAFDSDEDEEAKTWKLVNASLVGDPHASDKLKLMYDEVLNGLRARNITNRYEMWKNFSRGILRDTAGINTHSELDGRCRLSWFKQLYADPVRSTFTAEEYSRELFAGFSGGHRHFAELMPGIRERMDVPKREDSGVKFPLVSTPLEAVVEVKRCLLLAASAHARAFSRLTPADLSELNKNFLDTFVGPKCITGHTVPLRSVGRKHVDIMSNVDTAALYDGAEALLPLTNTALLDILMQLPENALPQVMMGGQKFQRLTTAAGDIIIGGRGKNVYDLDSPEMRSVICVISRGEEDTFREGTCNMARPVMVILAMGKKNIFVGTKPGIQGGSVMGISLLVDRAQHSSYSAADVAQGSTMGGVGILINYEGTSTYKGMRRVQGHALLGLGLLIDQGKGDASYKAALWAQGFGAPGGFGALVNTGNGNNHYYCGGRYIDSYPEHPGYDGWGQGVGAGIRQVANGGIGVILSGTGNDVYEADYFGHGGGYWLGVGIARDFGGNDIRYGTTTTTYDGRPRPGPGVQPRWTRFANGWGCHYALGYLFDDGGSDTYGGQIMGTGMAWDLAYGILASFNGDGKYTATGNMTQGVGAEASIGILFSYGGNDMFASRSQGFASGNVTYHPPASGGNFSFLINYGGENTYGSKAARHAYTKRGTPAGFVIDRPTEKEAAVAQSALRQAIEMRDREIAEYDAMIAQMREEAAQKGRRFVPPRQRRPVPISEAQLIGAVPDFDTNTRKADITETTVK